MVADLAGSIAGPPYRRHRCGWASDEDCRRAARLAAPLFFQARRRRTRLSRDQTPGQSRKVTDRPWVLCPGREQAEEQSGRPWVLCPGREQAQEGRFSAGPWVLCPGREQAEEQSAGPWVLCPGREQAEEGRSSAGPRVLLVSTFLVFWFSKN